MSKHQYSVGDKVRINIPNANDAYITPPDYMLEGVHEIGSLEDNHWHKESNRSGAYGPTYELKGDLKVFIFPESALIPVDEGEQEEEVQNPLDTVDFSRESMAEVLAQAINSDGMELIRERADREVVESVGAEIIMLAHLTQILLKQTAKEVSMEEFAPLAEDILKSQGFGTPASGYALGKAYGMTSELHDDIVKIVVEYGDTLDNQ